jgi:thiamine kinase-like enzyme
MNKPKKPAVVAKTAAKKRGRPVGSKNKTSTQQKPVDWEKLAKQLQQALATQIREADSYKRLFEELQANSKPVALLNFWQRVKLVFTGTY